ncbi:aspartate/tyrosine/aromatic aminotransferase [Siculibacillus lacustris]|uniref:Aspartate/tyrosine/aromatic aminotransferase n=1 Tax=Siculibacillus lacustris TaxID=1549641 RepID=A0A4Q9VN39_9HYPH|nr:amino acid aminotransferase [Siculibacillus lacustris]TBW36106.1 aspartate/tyrosine/aromatic aminotransferase [Siculibacillus lacustris]
MFESLADQPPDALLALIGLHRADPRPTKLDLGVGVYRDETGVTPIMAAVREAERILLDTRTTKSYLGPEGDPVFVDLLKPIVFGVDPGPRLLGVQTPGGTGALRLGAELIAAARPGARVLIGTPTWPNHAPIFTAAGLTLVPHRFFDVAGQRLDIDALAAALESAGPGDVVLLHGCCHNPTGGDLDRAAWARVAALVRARGILPFVDLAYQGLGEGLDEDAAGVRALFADLGEGLVAYSCDKNFGLYRDRVGALFGLAATPAAAEVMRSNMIALARVNWSMPPDHGAAIVRTVLESATLTSLWRDELLRMGTRVRAVRAALAAADPRLAFLTTQHGMFSTLPIDPARIAALRADHGVYMAGSGRINVAGLQVGDAPAFVAALAAVGWSV